MDLETSKKIQDFCTSFIYENDLICAASYTGFKIMFYQIYNNKKANYKDFYDEKTMFLGGKII